MTKLLGVVLIGVSASLVAEPLLDPTKPINPELNSKSTHETSEHVLTLDAVFISDTMQQAVINGINYRVGAQVGQMYIEQITPEFVALRKDQQVTKLFISNVTIKKDSNHVF